MKHVGLLILAAAATVAIAVYAAQDTTLDGVREVRDPVQLKEWLETNASDAEARIAALEAALLTEGYFDVVGTTQLVFIASGVTNVIDADITTP